MILNGLPHISKFTLNKETIEIVENYKNLGVKSTSKYVTNLFRTHYTSILGKEKLKTAVILRHGFHDDGLRLSRAIKLYKLVIRLLLEYCALSLF